MVLYIDVKCKEVKLDTVARRNTVSGGIILRLLWIGWNHTAARVGPLLKTHGSIVGLISTCGLSCLESVST